MANSDPLAEHADMINALRQVQKNIEDAAKRMNCKRIPTLVAISKTKPASMIHACYLAGHKVFGENYVQELVDKAKELPKDIEWHFVGHLQSNKVKALLEVENLEMVQTVDSEKLANKLNQQVMKMRPQRPLNVLVQVNTSGEESKSGVAPTECVSLVQHVIQGCPYLRFRGLMTIGSFDVIPTGEQPDFARLAECKRALCQSLAIPHEEVELSMGMSHDYVRAIEHGSTIVRVGSNIFGERMYNTTK